MAAISPGWNWPWLLSRYTLTASQISPAGPFWEAEPEHQDYLQRLPHGYTCHYIRPEWVLPQRQQ